MDDNPERPRVYLAGPEVFFPDTVEQGAEKKRLCAEDGFEGVYPLDNIIDGVEHLPRQELARRISHGNERLIRSCDLLIANCTPFRSIAMDVGTSFEIGFMQALGRHVRRCLDRARRLTVARLRHWEPVGPRLCHGAPHVLGARPRFTQRSIP